MKCRECDCCKKGWVKSRPDEYMCTGVKHPFVVKNINQECTEYPYLKERKINNPYDKLCQNLNIVMWELRERKDSSLNLCIKYIKDAMVDAERLNARLTALESSFAGQDDADCWSDD